MTNIIVKNPKQDGFTLIELMLVTALIAVLSLIGANAYHQQLVNFQTDKTALQMQQWLEGGVAYFVQNKQWPTPSALDPDCTINDLLEADPNQHCTHATIPATVVYVTPGSIDKNPWGGSYNLSVPNNPNNSTTTPQRFEVSITNLPNNNIAKRIAARLPSTDAIGDQDTTVNAYVSVPSQGSSPAGTVLSVHDYCAGTVPGKTASTPITIPDASKCAAGTKPTLHLAFQDWQSPGASGYTPDDNADLIANVAATVQIINGKWVPVLTVNGQTIAEPPTKTTNNCMLAIVSCDATSSSTTTAANKKNTSAFLF